MASPQDTLCELFAKDVSIKEKDENFTGFQGLDVLNLYRVCRLDQDISKGIMCKDPNSDRTVEQHVASGTTKGSRYISTTTDLDKAKLWAFYDMDTNERKPRDKVLPVIAVSIQKVKGTEQEKTLINLTNDGVLKHFIKGSTHRSWAKSSKEVLFKDKIPKYMYTVLDKLDKPEQPKPKKKIKCY